MRNKYSIGIRVLHWLMAILIFVNLGIGFYAEDLPKALLPQLMSLHKSLGVSLIILLFLRIIIRLTVKQPHFPAFLPQWNKSLAKLTYFSLYIMLLIVPASGYLMSNSFGKTVLLFGIEMPNLVAHNEEIGKILYEIHELAPIILLSLIGLHIIGFIKHLILDRVNLARRIS